MQALTHSAFAGQRLVAQAPRSSMQCSRSALTVRASQVAAPASLEVRKLDGAAAGQAQLVSLFDMHCGPGDASSRAEGWFVVAAASGEPLQCRRAPLAARPPQLGAQRPGDGFGAAACGGGWRQWQ